MSREIILRAISSLHNEVFDHFSKKFQGKLHFNCFFKRLKKVKKNFNLILNLM